MKAFTATGPNGETITYTDRKRWFWLMSVAFVTVPLPGIWMHAVTGNEAWLLLGVALIYGLGPVIDWVLGEDRNNPPDAVIMQLERDPYYRRLTYLIVPLHFLVFFGAAGYAGNTDLSPFGFIATAIAAGMTAGLAINTGHELGHKNSQFEKTLSKLALAVPAYGHFSIDHNRGHHVHVSTPEDCSSARMGESIYRFMLRDIPGAFVRAWRIEIERLSGRGKPAWHYDNQILQSYALSLAMALILIALFGYKMIAFLLVHHFFAYWQLVSANYVEHYGLLREKQENGRYQKCLPQHSWNSNHIFSNLALFHLERHSDHHANPLRRYQSLRHFDDLPQLPNGYFGVYLLAYVPPLWFRVMDKRLMGLPHVRGDLTRVNICPDARAAIFLEWGRDAMVEPRIDLT